MGETGLEYAQQLISVGDIINCSWYGYYFIWPWTNDQRNEWTYFNDAFGSKFNCLWISGELDRGEMDQLLGHAHNMGKTSVWLYEGEGKFTNDYDYWDAISEFSYYSYLHGFNKREERKYIYVWSYIGNQDPCTDIQVTSWDVTDIIDTGETRILVN